MWLCQQRRCDVWSRKICACPLHLSLTRRKTGGGLGEHLSERRHKASVQKLSPPVGEGGDQQLNRPLHGSEDLEEDAQL